MKKKLLSILFIIICLPISVFAKDKPFYNKFQTKDLDIDSQFSTYVDTIELNNSFITLNPYSDPYNDDEYAIILTKYDYDGEIIGQSKIENFYLWNVTNDDNYLYLLCESFDDLELKKIDTNLNIIKSYTFTEEEYEEIYNSYYYINSENSINVKGNKINILGESSILQLNLDLTTCYENTNYNAFYQLYPKTAKAMDLETEIYDSNDSYQVYLYENSGTPVVYSADSYTSIILLNKNGDELWRKKVNRYLNNNITNINDIRIIEDYIVVIENHYNYYSDEYYSEIIVYDFDGNEIQRLKQDDDYDVIIPLSLGFAISSFHGPVKGEYACEPDPLSFQSKKTPLFRQEIQPLNYVEESYCTLVTHEEFFYLYYFINSKVTGNGKIEFSNKAKAGQQVSFKTQPDPNFTVKSVTVKDVNGNTVNVNNGSFIMPEDDVVIEAEFVSLKNPYTKGGLIGLIVVSILIIGSYYFMKRQKLNY